MMIKIEALVREEKFEDVKNAYGFSGYGMWNPKRI